VVAVPVSGPAQRLGTTRSDAQVQAAVAAEVARHHLDVYGFLVHKLRPARHHQLWIDKLTALISGRLVGPDGRPKRKLLIIAPPGSAKSTWCSSIFPTWYLGNHPDQHILSYTAGDTQSAQFSGVVKGTFAESAEHLLVFPDPTCRPNEPRGWSNDGLYLKGTPAIHKDPAYRAVSYFQASIGARAHGIVLDDPLTQKQAQSITETNEAKTIYDGTIDSRLYPGGWTLAIMTRWSDFDLAAHFMSKPDIWEVVVMPALGDNGEYPWGRSIWPEYYTEDYLEWKRHDIGVPRFNAVWQGDPTSLGGTVFKSGAWFKQLPEDFTRVTATGVPPLRERLQVVQFWDLAYSGKTLADYTVCITAGIDHLKNVYLLNVLRKRLTPAEVLLEMVAQYRIFQPAVVGVEEPAFRQAVTRDLVASFQERCMGAIRTVPTKGKDKEARALLPASRAEAGKVFVDRTAPWFPEFEAEMLAFPLGKFNDQVDAFSGVMAILAQPALDYDAGDAPFIDRDVPGLAGAAARPMRASERFGPNMFKRQRLLEREQRSRALARLFARGAEALDDPAVVAGSSAPAF
jgi:predicted phage terminase large subunit-like protein